MSLPLSTSLRALALAVLLTGATVAEASPKPRKPARTTTSRRPKPFARIASRKVETKAQPTLTALPTLPTLLVPRLLESSTGETTFAMDTAPARPFAAFSASAERMLSSLVDRARSQVGTRYVFGGNEPGEGLDCSSFVRFAMEALGMKLPRTAAQQARIGAAVPKDRSALKPGDLLTFGSRRRTSHVGIYLGEGKFIHASVTSGQIIETTIERNRLLFRKWTGARRLMADGDTTGARGDS